MTPFIQYPIDFFSPEFMEMIHYPEDRLSIPFIRAKIPSLCILAAILPEMLDQNHVPMQWIQNVLPGADRVRISHLHWLPCKKGSHCVRHEAILCPVASADHVSSSSGRHGRDHRTFAKKERVAIGRGHEFSASLAARIGIMAAHWLMLLIALHPSLVLVAFITRHHESCSHTLYLTNRLEHIDCAHRVRGKGFDGILIGTPNQGLCCHVNYNFGFIAFQNARKGIEIAHIAENGNHSFFNIRQSEEIRLGWRS